MDTTEEVKVLDATKINIKSDGSIDKRTFNKLPSRGRPKGMKNKATIFKEVIREGFEKRLLKDGMRVIDAVVEQAIEGNMQAAKLLLDRILPTTKSIDLEELEKRHGVKIQINVGSLEKDKGEVLEGEVVG